MISVAKEKTIALISGRWFGYMLIAFIFACAIMYIYLANTTVRTLAVLEKVKAEVQTRSVEVSELEARRLSIDNTLSSSMAKSLGMLPVANQTFIMDRSKGKLSFNIE